MPAVRCVSPATTWGIRLALLLALGSGSAALSAAPYTPSNDAAVLETLPTRFNLTQGEDIRKLRAQLQANPNDISTLTTLAQRYIDIGREQADPRYYGYAEALLKPWWTAANPPADILLLRATLRQHTHAYTEALQDLHQLVKQYPNQTQGWLTLAVVQSVRGEYPAAKHSCAALALHASTWYSSLCYSQMLSLTGNAERAYALQTTLLPSLERDQVELRQWLQTLLGETALRLGNNPAAETHFQAALAEPRSDHYLLRVYSDYLLSQQRPLDVIKLLQDKSSDDALLLRLAIASRDAQQTEATRRYQQQLEARYEAARLRGSSLHARDEALYLLAFNGDAAKALTLAKANWALQKESEDTHLLLLAAHANDDQATQQSVRTWLQAQGQQDARLETLL